MNINTAEILNVMDALIHLVEAGYGPEQDEAGHAERAREARTAMAAIIAERDAMQTQLDEILAAVVGNC